MKKAYKTATEYFARKPAFHTFEGMNNRLIIIIRLVLNHHSKRRSPKKQKKWRRMEKLSANQTD